MQYQKRIELDIAFQLASLATGGRVASAHARPAQRPKQNLTNGSHR